MATATPALGRLPTDRPHQFKVQANYELPFGTLIGANEYIASGIPVTREAAAISPSNFPIQYLGRLSDGRTPTVSQTDLTVSHQFRLGTRSFTVGMDIINLFDQKTAINKFMTQLQSADGRVQRGRLLRRQRRLPGGGERALGRIRGSCW